MLPRLMVAPNGARLGPADHPALPVTHDAIVATALACHAAGADGLHAHVRDAEGRHVLDAVRYRALLDELAGRAPSLRVQVTTEAVDRYTPGEQRALVEDLRPAAVSVGLREMLGAGLRHDAATLGFYRDCAHDGIQVQHILYSPEEVRALADLVSSGGLDGPLAMLFVLGRHRAPSAAQPTPADLEPFVDALTSTMLTSITDADWAVCAFGPHETDCLVAAAHLGGKLRVGFENNLRMRDGSLAPDNAARVSEIVELLAE